MKTTNLNILKKIQLLLALMKNNKHLEIIFFLKIPIYSGKIQMIVFRIVDEEKMELERIKIVNEGNFSLFSYHEYPEVG